MKKNVSRIRKKTIYNFAWGLVKATKKVYLICQKWKKTKNTYGIHPTKFASSTQNHKKISEHQIYQSGRKFFQKKYA
jgi:hypothetical protein